MVGTGSISQQDFVIDDYALLLCFVVERLKVFRLGFEIIIGHPGLGLNHRDCPYRTFGIRRVALRSAEICECRTYGDAGNKNQGFVHIYRLSFCGCAVSYNRGFIFICQSLMRCTRIGIVLDR